MTSSGRRVRPTSARPGAATLDDLKGQILAAQKARTLINDPAVYRLDFIVRLLATLTLLGDLVAVTSVYQTPEIARDLHIQRLGFGGGGNSAFAGWVSTVCIRQALGLFLVCVFWRVIKQIQRNQARELTSTIPVVAHVYLGIIAANVMALPFWLVRTPSRTESVRAVWSTLIGVTVLSLLIVLIRRHARNAAPVLAARLGDPAPSTPTNRYVPLRYLFIVCAGVAILLTAVGYVRTGPSA